MAKQNKMQANNGANKLALILSKLESLEADIHIIKSHIMENGKGESAIHNKILDKYSHNANNKINVITKEDTNVFIKPVQGQSNPEISRVKRATVVGNPMFSSNADEGNNDEESLSLDDLDMDYEQIMHYFDNLKESNA